MLAFILGVALSFNVPVDIGSVVLPILAMLAVLSVGRTRSSQALGWLGFGVVWGAAALAFMQQARPPNQLAPADVRVTGQITGLVERDGEATRFRLRPESITSYPEKQPLPQFLKLSWYGFEGRIAPGQRWRLPIRLERPRGLMNPVGFDYERYLAGRRVDAVGYVRSNGGHQKLEGQVSAGAVRSRLANRLRRNSSDSAGAAVLRAIALGDRRALDDELWETLRRTGTAHLVAISGLHIGLAAALGWFGGRRLMTCLPWLSARLPARPLSGLLALAMAAAYAQLAGWAMPTVRALLMLALGVVGVLARRRWSPMRLGVVAMLGITLVAPWSLLNPGFWLSFGAVFLLIAGATAAPTDSGRIGLMWRLQALLTLGMAVLTLGFFSRAAWIALPVNLVAIPVFSFLLVPAALVVTACIGLAPGSLLAREATALVVRGLDFAVRGLDWAAALAGSFEPASPGTWAAALALAGVGMLLRGLVALPVTWGAAAMMVLPVGSVPEERLRLTVLEVGQGTAAVVETPKYTLAYDTGPSWGETPVARFSLWPYLDKRDRVPVDDLIVSHRDEDHAAGLAMLRERQAYRRLRVGGTVSNGERPCEAGTRWQRDGVSFRMIWPPSDNRRRGNPGSCVLLIEARDTRILLTGDITRAQDAAIRRRLHEPVDIVLVPHHGSDDASSAALVERLNPLLAIVSAGHDNAYGLPDARVVDRYRCHGARVLTTGTHGAVTLTVDHRGHWREFSERRDRRRFYHEGVGRAGFRGPELIEYDPVHRRIPACLEGTR